jgi:hypothetical protein
VPAVVDAFSRDGTDELLRPVHDSNRAGFLQVIHVLEAVPVGDLEDLNVVDAPFGLALVPRSVDPVRVRREFHLLRVALVAVVDLGPGSAPGGNTGLEVVEPDEGRDASQKLKGPVVPVQPGEHVLAPAPDDHPHPGVGQGHEEGRKLG